MAIGDMAGSGSGSSGLARGYGQLNVTRVGRMAGPRALTPMEITEVAVLGGAILYIAHLGMTISRKGNYNQSAPFPPGIKVHSVAQTSDSDMAWHGMAPM